MKKTIKVQSPLYLTVNGHVNLKLQEGNEVGEIAIDFRELLQFANLATPEVIDFFLFSSAVYGIDRFIKRRINSVDGWSRDLKVKFPVADPVKWNASKQEFDSLLSFLTGDYWDTEFYRSTFSFPQKELDEKFNTTFSQVNLFSGGLDSLIGAIDFLKSNNTNKVLFASHYDDQMKGPKGDQEVLISKLKTLYPNKFECVPSVKVALKNSTLSKETTFRSRSILFIGIALLIAKGKNVQSIKVPENGSVSLNYPLSSSRRSACSTRTTHPTVLDLVKLIWNKLNITISIDNPYEFKTKGEMVTNCMDRDSLQKVISISNSCGKRGHRSHWSNPRATHCGTCMPCIYRKASLLSMNDKTTYGNSVNSLIPFKTKKGQDIGACLEFLRLSLSSKDVTHELIINGIKNINKLNQYTDLVMRTRNELKELVRKIGNNEVKTKAGI
jgi:7-cyano-7-deazaguanine synthase in queuosine biosynthesis